MNQVDEFFKGLPTENEQQADVFEDKKPPTEAPEKEEAEGEPVKNRRHRRLEAELQRERESNIALNERVKVLSEVDQFRKDAQQEGLDPDLVEVFGPTDAGKRVAGIMQKKINDAVSLAEERALERMESEQQRVVEEQRQYESVIDSELESLEDEHGIDLTSDAPTGRKNRRELLEMVQKLSPKDDNGTITGYADFGSTFELWQSQQSKPESRNKEIANRTMQRSNTAAQETKITPGFRGWEKDYNL